MKSIDKISILTVLLLYGTVASYSQCDTYLQKANTLFADKKYEDAKRQYSNYKECKPNATGIDAKIAECDRLQKEATDNQRSNSNSSRYYRAGTSSDTQTRTYGRGADTQTESNTQKPERISGKIYIGISSFSGYKNDQVETNATAAFTRDGRFVVCKIQSSGWGRNTQGTSTDVDYTVNATSTCTQYEKTEYMRIGNQSIPYKVPEIVQVAFTVTNAKTGEIVVNTTYNLNNIYSFPSDIFPVKFSIKKLMGKKPK